MTTQAGIAEAISDLPPRTWRGWWLERPKWLRIGCWAVLGLILLHIALAVRIAIGLREAKEVVAFRERGAYVFYSWQNTWDRRKWRPWYELMTAGVWGRSGNNVRYLDLFDATGNDLRVIGKAFCNVEELGLFYVDIRDEDLLELQRCKRLKKLRLEDTNIDDMNLEYLLRIGSLKELWLEGTLITDASIETLKKMPFLEFVELTGTDVSDSAIEKWRTSQTNGMPKIRKFEDHFHENDFDFRLVYRWADGKGSGIYTGPCEWAFLKGSHREPSSAFMSGSNRLWIDKALFRRSVANQSCLKIMIGDREAEPILIPSGDGEPINRRLEIRMPITREQALAIQREWERRLEEEREDEASEPSHTHDSDSE